VEHHPYYKGAWDAEVHPTTPVSRVVVNLEFSRLSNDDTPQLAGTLEDAVEYMGRFDAPSERGRQVTTLAATDTFGDAKPLIRKAEATPVGSIVGYPYAQTLTGTQHATTTKNSFVTMGEVGEYVASV